MLRKCTAVLLLVAMVLMMGCAAHTHKVGHGAVLNRTRIVERQWYLLYGLVPINEVDTHAMIGGKNHYEMRTEVTVMDFIYISLFSPLTVTCRTVTVRR